MMLQNLGKLEQNTAHYSIEVSFRQTNDKIKNWLNDKPNIEVLFVEYKDAIENGNEVIQQLNTFFNSKLNTEDMQQVIDKKMYRTQK